MTVDPIVQDFLSHERSTILFLQYVLMVQRVLPEFAVRVPKDRLSEMGPLIGEVIDLCREIYKLPDLGNEPPNPIPFDKTPLETTVSDHVRERVGKYNPTWDLINAPFTHPIGTQLALLCVESAWNAYDTMVKSLKRKITREHPSHANVLTLKGEKGRATGSPTLLSTDEELAILGIAAPWDDVRCFLERTPGFHVPPGHAETTFNVAKQLRSARVHHFGKPTKWLLDFMAENAFADFQLRMVDGEMEVTTVFSRNAIETIEARALVLINVATSTYAD